MKELFTEETNQRMAFIGVPYSLVERFGIWFRGVLSAIFTLPEKTKSVSVILNPGDAGYDDAFFRVQKTTYSMEMDLIIKPNKTP